MLDSSNKWYENMLAKAAIELCEGLLFYIPQGHS